MLPALSDVALSELTANGVKQMACSTHFDRG